MTLKPLLLALPLLALFLVHIHIKTSGSPLSETQRLVDEINSANIGWTATVYPNDLHMSLGKLDGGHLLNSQYGLKLKDFSVQQLNEAPDSFDSRTAWPNCESIKDIRNQEKCGSCWAFSSAAVFSDRYCIGSNQ